MSQLTTLIANVFNGNVKFATMVMSLIPLIELKGGIVFATSQNVGYFLSFLLAYIGSTVVFIPVFFLLKPLLNGLKRWKLFNGFAVKVENYFQNKANETEKQQIKKSSKSVKNEIVLKQLGVFVFVAIPLPMTGVWTGTAIAVFLGLSFRKTILPVIIGNFIAGLLILGLSALCIMIGIDLNIVLWCLLAMAVLILAFTIFKISKQNSKDNGDKR